MCIRDRKKCWKKFQRAIFAVYFPPFLYRVWSVSYTDLDVYKRQGLTYEEAALRYIQSGANIAIVYPSEGTSSSPSGMAIVKDCQNLKNAQKFIDYLSSKEVQEQLGDLNRRSVRSDVSDPDTMEAWDKITFVNMDCLLYTSLPISFWITCL